MPEQHPSDSGPIASELVQKDPSFADLVLQFVDGLKSRLNQMEEAVRASDFEALRRTAHQLKGSGGGYGYPILTQKAAILERHAGAAALDECLDALDELKVICDRVVVGPQST